MDNARQIDAADVQRLNRLSEEVRGRLVEIAMIAARLAEDRSFRSGTARNFVPREAGRTKANARSGDWMEVIDVDGHEVCYGSIGGKPFAESPCGAS